MRNIGGMLALAGALALAPLLSAQSQNDSSTPSRNKPAADGQSSKPAPKPTSGDNPFPEDTTSIPVIPVSPAPASSDRSSDSDANSSSPLPATDRDPARSPEDPSAGADAASQDGESSSSFSGMDRLLPQPETDANVKNKKQPTSQEAAAHDVEVGGYYLDRKDWKAALSRFQSALVLDPENPEVYWGLGEAERHLGDNAKARTDYRQLLNYDPDGPHGKEARKLLKDPALADTGLAGSAQHPADAPKP